MIANRQSPIANLEGFVAAGQAAQRAANAVVERAAPVRARTLNPTCFLNASACREFLLEFAGTRAHKFERVSGKTLHELNEHLRALMISTVRRLPSKGKTI
jgi:hypothetical protein